ncbi:MAG: helix-hairpin-helix domain-containing protein [Cocleimonas sp.]
MFENAVTQTYTQQDATLEILTMLGGAFLLGCLLCWLIRGGLEAKNKTSNNQSDHVDTLTPQEVTERSSSKTSSAIGNNASKPRTVVTPSASGSSYTTPKIDDLTKITGINTNIQEQLKANGINSFTDLRDSNKESLGLSSALNLDSKEIESWPHQASLAEKGEWKKLTEYQDFSQRARNAHKSTNNDLTTNKDDLKKIEGIGPRIEEILNKQGIYTFETLRKTDRDTLKKYLVTADKRFDANETESWPHQAGMAEKGQWEELKIYQEFIDEGDDDAVPAATLTTKRVSPAPFTNNVSNITKNDDLKKIEGIGPKIQELLQKNGISSFEQLKGCSRESLMDILENAGPQYRMHEPKTWPEQAQMAFQGNWKQLTEFQDLLLGNRN